MCANSETFYNNFTPLKQQKILFFKHFHILVENITLRNMIMQYAIMNDQFLVKY